MSQAGVLNLGNIPPPPGSVVALEGNDSVVVHPDGAGIIHLLGEYTVQVTGNAGTHTETISPTIRGYPITPFVVGPSTFAGYQTIQSALNAANAAGGGAVYVQPGTYTENLTFYPTSQIVGANSNSDIAGNASIVTINGIHTPPTTGSISINNVYLNSATDIFNSAAAGSAILILENVNVNCTNGYTFNLPNWTGALAKFNVQDDSTNNGIVNNTGGAIVYLQSSNNGAGTANTMIVSGPTVLKRCDLSCPIQCVTGATIESDFTIHEATITMSNNSAGSFRNSEISSGSSPAIIQSSSGPILLLHSIIDSTNVPAIDGAGIGTITYSDIVFVNNASFAGTLTLSTTSWKPYAQAIVSTDGTKVGTAAFNSAQFTVDANGFVSTSGSGMFTWQDQAISAPAVKGNGYFSTAAITMTLPAAPAEGDSVAFIVDSASTLTIQANAGQKIRIGTVLTAIAGIAVNTTRGDSITLVYRSTGATWFSLNGPQGIWQLT